MPISKSVQLAKKDSQPFGWLSFLFATAELVLCSLGYESDERSSLGERGERRRWQEEGGGRVPGSIVEAADLSARKILGTANGAAEPTLKYFRSGADRALPYMAEEKDRQDVAHLV